MTGRKQFGELTKAFPDHRRKRIGEKTTVLLEEMTMSELRQALDRTQEDLARDLDISQPAVARMERRRDMYVSNLRRVVEALGGELEIRARFPQGTVKISNLGTAEDLREKVATR
jgi:transcriptional regulator with XRE-family HTH domain